MPLNRSKRRPREFLASSGVFQVSIKLSNYSVLRKMNHGTIRKKLKRTRCTGINIINGLCNRWQQVIA